MDCLNGLNRIFTLSYSNLRLTFGAYLVKNVPTVLTCIAFIYFASTSIQAAENQPNILWIISDDHRADSIQSYNRAVSGKSNSPLGYVSSPNTDRLAEEGVLFTRAYCNAPACAPSRASMQTGRYTFRNGIYGFKPAHNRADFCRPTIPELMKQAGYHSAMFGKSGYYIFGERPWSDLGLYQTVIEKKSDLAAVGSADFLDEDHTTETYFYPDGAKIEIPKDKDTPERRKFESEQEILRAYIQESNTLILGGQSTQPTEKTLDGRIEGAFEHWLQQVGQKYSIPSKLKGNKLGQKDLEGPTPGKPIFVHLGFHFPHTPVLPPKSFREQFKIKEKEVPYSIPEFSPQDIEKLPPQLQKLYEKAPFHKFQEEDKRQAIRDYYAYCAFGDELAGRAIDAFKNFSKKNGREWIIVYVIGDHGWHLGEQGIETKFAPYETSNRGAIIVASSDKSLVPKGVVSDRFVEYIDLAPSFTTWAGVQKPDYFDGKTFSETLRNKEPLRSYVLAEMNHVYGPRAYLRSDKFAFSMKTRHHTKPGQMIKWAMEAPLVEVEPALFDLRNDPKERVNVALDPKYSMLCEWFRNKLGNIVLGDGRIECDWTVDNSFHHSDFAKGAHDNKLDIPDQIIPKI